jgi:hypothetical protein
MPDLSFHVEQAESAAHTAAPLLLFKLQVRQSAQQGELAPIHAVALRCQIRIEPAKRRYGGQEPERLTDLFAGPDRWNHTMRPLLWTHASIVLPPFTESVAADLPVPCSFDFNVATTKYFSALETGEIPLSLLFSGTIFHENEAGELQIAQIPWDREARFRLPVQVWRDMMDHYYPQTAWLNLRRDVFDRLYQFKSRHSLPTWERAIEMLLLEDSKRGAP